MIDAFDTLLQDLDFFWLGGSYICYRNAVDRFKRKAQRRILKQKYFGRLTEFLLYIEEDRTIRIQFVFGRESSNIPFILYTFDIDIVQVGFNGKEILSVSSIQSIFILIYVV